jgi:hypothetical protein
MKKRYLGILAVSFFLLIASSKAFACDCTAIQSVSLAGKVNKAWNESAAIFTGIVEGIVRDEKNRQVTVKFKLIKSWKGELSPEFTVVTGWGDGDCGFGFDEGETYLVYATKSGLYNANGQFVTNICSRTAAAKTAQKDIALLNKRKKMR